MLQFSLGKPTKVSAFCTVVWHKLPAVFNKAFVEALHRALVIVGDSGEALLVDLIMRHTHNVGSSFHFVTPRLCLCDRVMLLYAAWCWKHRHHLHFPGMRNGGSHKISLQTGRKTGHLPLNTQNRPPVGDVVADPTIIIINTKSAPRPKVYYNGHPPRICSCRAPVIM